MIWNQKTRLGRRDEERREAVPLLEKNDEKKLCTLKDQNFLSMVSLLEIKIEG